MTSQNIGTLAILIKKLRIELDLESLVVGNQEHEQYQSWTSNLRFHNGPTGFGSGDTLEEAIEKATIKAQYLGGVR